MWHERLLLVEVSPGTWVCGTPDGDQYVEQLEMEIHKQRRKAREEEASAKEATKRGKQHQGGGAS